MTGLRKAGLFFLLFLGMCFCLRAEYATILYFNDGHIIYPLKDNLGERGGVARLKTVVDSVKKDNPDTISVFGGDLAGGLLFGAVYHGFPMVEAFNEVPIDYANFGQHDFDFGPEETLKLIANSKFQWFTSNLVGQDGKTFGNLPSYIIRNVGGIKIALIGLTDDMDTTTPSEKVKQLDLEKATAAVLEKIKAEKPDFIAVVTQSSPVSDEALIKKFPEIGAVFSEEISETKSAAAYFGDRPVLSSCGNLGSIVRLNIYRNDGKVTTNMTVYPVDDKVASDPGILKLEEKYKQKLEADLGKKIAVLKQPLDAGFDSDSKARVREANVGDLIADSYRDFYKTDVAFINGGGIRANAPSGDFTLKNALAILPFSNTVCVYKCKGSDILKALEHAVSGVEKFKGSFLQISGGKYKYSPDNKAGARILSVEIGGQPLDPSREYIVAMPSFIYKGGDGFDMFKDAVVIVPEGSARKDIELFSDYCRKLGTIDIGTDGRIEVVKKELKR